MMDERDSEKKAVEEETSEVAKTPGNEPEPSRGEDYSFLQETVKDEQITGKRIWSRALGTAGRGLLFGLAACVAFYALSPLAQRWFDGKKEPVSIPADQEEEDLPPEEQTEEDAQEPVVYPELTVENYREMSDALYEVASAATSCVAEVRAVGADEGLNVRYDEVRSVTGLVVWQNASEVLVLAPSRILEETGSVGVVFQDYVMYEAVLKKQDRNLGLAVFSVDRRQLTDTARGQIQTATLGNSNIMKRGDTLICLGAPFGYAGGVGYGIVSSARNQLVMTDGQIRLLCTDIAAAPDGTGILFNLNGEVVGVADQQIAGADSRGLVTAYAISGIKEYIEDLSNGHAIPYLGIKGVEVTEGIAQDQALPRGIYVQEVVADSPAMQAGIQSGDVITEVDGSKFTSLAGYRGALMATAAGQEIRVRGQRQGAEGYVGITFNVTVGSME